MNQTKKKNRPSKYLVIMSVILSILCIALMAVDVIACRETNLIRICKEKSEYLETMMYSGQKEPEQIIAYIQDQYPTSASDYCFVAVDDKLIYIRDDNYTKGIDETDVDAYFEISEHTPRLGEGMNACRVWLGGQAWNVIRHEETTQNGHLTVGICINEAYQIAEGDFDLLFQHSMLYMALFSVAFIVSVVFLSHREKENEMMEQKLTQQLEENRRLIGRLGERLEAQSGVDYQRENGFCTKEVVEKVMEKLTPEQRSKSRKILIHMRERDPQAVVRYSVLLERMKVNKSVCCLWNDEEFLVLLLNTEETGASNFAKQLLLQYQNMFQNDARDIEISFPEW